MLSSMVNRDSSKNSILAKHGELVRISRCEQIRQGMDRYSF
jgi:hypothetical protein